MEHKIFRIIQGTLKMHAEVTFYKAYTRFNKILWNVNLGTDFINMSSRV